MSLPHNSIRAVGLATHVDAGQEQQNGRGYKEFKHYLEYGDEFGLPMTINRLAAGFNRTHMTVAKWIRLYCEDEGIRYPNDLKELLIKNRKAN